MVYICDGGPPAFNRKFGVEPIRIKGKKVEKWLVNYIPKNYEKAGEMQCENGLKNERYKQTTRQIVKARRRGGREGFGERKQKRST